jgi:hypothetical protein
MISLFKYRIATAVLLLPLMTLAGVGRASAQGGDIVGGAVASRKDLSGGAGSSGSVGGGGGGGTIRPPKKQRQSVQNARRNSGGGGGGGSTYTPPPAPSLGSLSVVTEPGAMVYLDPPGNAEGLEGRADADGLFIFDRLRPGNYTVSAEINDKQFGEKPINIVKSKAESVSLKAPIYNATVTTNINKGSVRYASAVITGNEYTPTGKTIYVELNGGSAALTGLKPGRYIADVIPTDPGYEQEQISFTIPDNLTIPVRLENRSSTGPFSDAFGNLDSWEAPAGWRASSGILTASGQGIGLPRSKDYRFYKDFQLSSDVKMVNGVAASFVLRAKDARNYYLVQLTGANADEPYVLRGYIVRDGVSTQMGGKASIIGFSSTLKTNQFFKVKMLMADNRVKVYVTDSQTGEELPLGILTDPNNIFPIGAPGLAVRDSEQNVIGNFIVCTPSCR